MDFTDTLTLDGLRRTNDGYLVASVRAARTGVQEYRGIEVDPNNEHGMRDRATVRVYRSEAEVFHKDSLASFAHRPVTVDHPPVQVTADNWSQYAVGQTDGEIVRDGQFVRVPMVVMDGDAIRSIESGKRQISQGYSCDLKWGDGVSPDGLAYDAEQVSIRGNHTAIVGLARGGSELKIGDQKMPKMVTLDGHSVELSDAAAILFDNLKAKLTTVEAANTKLTTDAAGLQSQIATLTTNLATKDAELVTVTKKLADAEITPAKLRDAAKSYAATVSLAAQVAPKFTVTDAMDENAIKSGVVKSVIGDAAKDWNDVQIATSFATLTAGKTPTTVADSFAQDFQTFTPAPQGVQKVNDARSQMIADMTNPKPAANAA